MQRLTVAGRPLPGVSALAQSPEIGPRSNPSRPGSDSPAAARLPFGPMEGAAAASYSPACMPTNVKIIHARDFIRATPGGVLDLKASERLLLDVAEASGRLPDVDLLLDTRNTMTVLSTADLWAL